MKRDARLYDIVQALRDGRLHTASELAARLGVSTRTIWRDMEMLAATGLPVTGERGLGYILRSPLMLPPTMLTPEELEALNGFPRGFTDIPGISDAQRGFLMGNALVVGIVRRIGCALIEADGAA